MTAGAIPDETDVTQSPCADTDTDGFGLHAAARSGADDRQALEGWCQGPGRVRCRTGNLHPTLSQRGESIATTAR